MSQLGGTRLGGRQGLFVGWTSWDADFWGWVASPWKCWCHSSAGMCLLGLFGTVQPTEFLPDIPEVEMNPFRSTSELGNLLCLFCLIFTNLEHLSSSLLQSALTARLPHSSHVSQIPGLARWSLVGLYRTVIAGTAPLAGFPWESTHLDSEYFLGQSVEGCHYTCDIPHKVKEVLLGREGCPHEIFSSSLLRKTPGREWSLKGMLHAQQQGNQGFSL